MDRRSFLKAAAAAAVIPALPAIAAPSPAVTIADGAITSAKLSLPNFRNCVVLYQHGKRWFDAQGKVWMTEVGAGADVADLGDVRVVMGLF